MADNSIYTDIAKRTGGDIYIGVVGPVRTGKSTFIGRFLESVVLPNIKNEYDRERTEDTTPQSATGRTVMTTEPKFVPDESVKISVGDGTELNIKLIDCVGYMVDGALGDSEDGIPRMVATPWSDEPVPFSRAAELGTEKVISEHATIGMLVTTDGSFGEIERDAYIAAEERVAGELKALGKPFAIVLNSARPGADEAKSLALELEKKYGAPVALVSCPQLSAEDIMGILGLVLGEFPIRRLDFHIPEWARLLPGEHPLTEDIMTRIRQRADKTRRIGDITKAGDDESDTEVIRVDAGEGVGELSVNLSDEEFYEITEELTGFAVDTKEKLLSLLLELTEIKHRYERIKAALDDAEEKGYGIVMPSPDEMTLDEPSAVRSGGGYGVRISARAESIHMIKTGIRAELCPIIGTEEQSEEVVKLLMREYEAEPDKIWETNILGKTLYDLVKDGMTAKLSHMPDEARGKLGETIEKIINDGANGLICILL